MDSKLENADDENSMMEISEENESRKRKADDTFPVDSSDVGEKEEQVDDEDITISEEEKMDVSSREEGQEWDVDSFDVGHQYTTKKKVDPNDEEAVKMRRYRLQMYQTNGFNVDMENYPGRVAYRELWAVDLDEPFRSSGLTGRVYMQNCVDLAIQRYNRINQKTVTCEHIVRAIICVVDGIKSYITFMARETPHGNLVEYQAKTEKKFWQKHAHALFCRPTPIPRVIQVPKDEDCDPITDGIKSYITFMARETPHGNLVEYQAKTEKKFWQKHAHALFCRPTPIPRVIQVPKDEDCDPITDGSSSDGSSRESDQEWDVDSLDDESDYKPPDMLAPTDEEIEKMRLYRPHMYRSKGFYVDGESYSGEVVYFSQVVLDEPLWLTGITGREFVQRMIDISLEKYNEIKGSSVTCESIVRAILTRVTGFKMYITFMARESPGGDLVEYQAKTERKVWQKKTHVIFCRPTPKSKDI